jgi:hypothetical protein
MKDGLENEENNLDTIQNDTILMIGQPVLNN